MGLIERQGVIPQKFARMLRGQSADIGIVNSGHMVTADFYTKNAIREVRLVDDNLLSNKAKHLQNSAAQRFGLKEVETMNNSGNTSVNLVFNHDISGIVPGVDSVQIGKRQFYVNNIAVDKSQELFRELKRNS